MASPISVDQQTALIDYLEVHPQLALGRCTRSKEGRSLSKRRWADCANILNSISADCTQKTGEQWRTYYNEYKSKLLKKIKCEKNERSATGGGPPALINLTPLQERLYSILGQDVGEPLKGVRHNPLIIEGDGARGPSTSTNTNDVIELDGDLMMVPEEQINFDFIEFERQSVAEYTESVAETEKPLADNKKTQKLKKKEKSKKKKQKENIGEFADELEREPTMREAAASLQNIERMNADAMLVHATAINRLAAAIERIADRLPVPAVIMPGPPPARNRRRRAQFSSSESE